VDAYVSNTHSEGFGLANVEAALTGIPIVLPAWPVNREILGIFPNVSFYKLASDHSLDEALNKLMDFSRQEFIDGHPLNEGGMRNPYTKNQFRENWLDKIIIPMMKELKRS
jgi:glycosyltransferase involved in cell wall biosynthesis